MLHNVFITHKNPNPEEQYVDYAGNENFNEDVNHNENSMGEIKRNQITNLL